MIQLHQEIDFGELNPEEFEFVKKACDELVEKQMREDMSVLQKPALKLDLTTYVLINNLPQITEDKQQKLTQVLCQILNKQQLSKDYDNKYVVINLTGQGLIKFVSEESAQKGVKILKDFPLDAKHKLQAFTLKEFDLIQSTKNEYTPLNLKKIKHLQEWLDDPQRRNQLLFIQDQLKLSIQWFQHLNIKLEEYVKEKQLPPHTKAEWSRNGTYLVLYTEDGFQLYGGNSFELLHQFFHKGVTNVTFSNNEDFAISFNNTSININDPENYIIWKIREEQRGRIFKADQLDVLGTYQFSSSGEFIARIESDFLTFYRAPDYYIWENKFQIPNIQNFHWIEKTNQIIYACYSGSLREHDRQLNKTQITIMELPSKKEIKWRNIQFESDRVDFFSHEQGKWVCAVLKRKIKKKVVSTIIQVANLKKTDMLDIADKEVPDEVEQIFFDQRQGKMALSFRDRNQRTLPIYTYQIFSIIDEGKSFAIKDSGVLKQKETNELLWSPNGTYFVLINKVKGSPDQGKIEFGMIQKKSENNVVTFSTEITKQSNHFYMSHASWDPSGICFVTMSDQWSSIMIWSAIGEQLIKDTITKINEISWRPRPTYLLNEKDEETLNKTQKDYMKKYEIEDDKILNKAKYDREQKRDRMREQFTALLQMKKQKWREAREKRKQLTGFDEDDLTQLVTIEVIEREEIVATEKQQQQ